MAWKTRRESIAFRRVLCTRPRGPLLRVIRCGPATGIARRSGGIETTARNLVRPKLCRESPGPTSVADAIVDTQFGNLSLRATRRPGAGHRPENLASCLAQVAGGRSCSRNRSLGAAPTGSWPVRTVLREIVSLDKIAILEDIDNVRQRPDVCRRISIHHENIGLLAHLKAAQLVIDPTRFGCIAGSRHYGL